MNRLYLFQDLISPHHLFNKIQYMGDEKWDKLERHQIFWQNSERATQKRKIIKICMQCHFQRQKVITNRIRKRIMILDYKSCATVAQQLQPGQLNWINARQQLWQRVPQPGSSRGTFLIKMQLSSAVGGRIFVQDKLILLLWLIIQKS